MLKVQQEITVLEVPLPGGGGVTCDTIFSRIYVYRTILGMRGTSVISRVFGEMVGALLSNRRLSQVNSADYLRRKHLSHSAVDDADAHYIGGNRRLSRAYFSSAEAGLK